MAEFADAFRQVARNMSLVADSDYVAAVERDALVGFELAEVPIDDPEIVATIGRTHHANVVVTGRAGSRVNGTVFEITDAELAAADRYEASADYVRILAKLASGRDAWVYVSAPRPGDG